MPRKREGARVLGPYSEIGRCRILVVYENGQKENHFANTWEAAVRLRAKLQRKLKKECGASLRQRLAEFREYRVGLGRAKPATIEHEAARVGLMLGAFLSEPPMAITHAQAAAIYEDHVARPRRTGRPLAAATHRWDLLMTRAFFAWMVGRGHVTEDPFAAVEPVGRVNTGKPQLRIDEARRFTDAALAEYEATSHPLALGAVCALLLGLRSAEVRRREVRDLDDGGRVLWVPSGKTKNARRRLEVPEALREPLQRLAGGRPPEALLFAGVTGRAYTRSSFGRAVERLCKQAGVPVVCPHSLRGLHASLAVESGATSAAVAAALGHGSFAVTARHYAQADAVANAKTSRVAGALGVESEVSELLRGMDAVTLRELLEELRKRRR